MSSIRFFTDEHIHGQVSARLVVANFDAVSTPQARRFGETDRSQLIWAHQEQRVIVTFNVGHFAQLHYEWLSQGLHHSWIVVSQQRPIGDMLRRLLNLAQTLSAESMQNRLVSEQLAARLSGCKAALD
jgi:hypothetical protein